jgi:amino acid adenylation domain-containing protein/non-ribosomal peptide synthase protein (TIGR01720 family)
MKNIEDIYPLSPLQQGMLFSSLLEPGAGIYVNQCSCTLNGKLDPELFRQTWQYAVDRHQILRSAFLWEGLEEPLQAVRRQVALPWEVLDWQELPAGEREVRLEELRAAERLQPLPFAKAPLMRLKLVRLTADSYEFIWTFHHILLDGWSTPVLLREIFGMYQALRSGAPLALPAARQYREYIAWLEGQGLERAEAFWRRTLAGFTAATPLAFDWPEAGNGGRPHERSRRSSAELTSSLQRLAVRCRLTLNTVVQGAWALLLSRYSGEEDVVFGAVVSGRPVDLPGVESIIGLFINTVPVRAAIAAAEPLGSWLETQQKQQVELRQYEHSPLHKVLEWSEVPRGLALFESLLAFENYPLGGLEEVSAAREFKIGGAVFREQANLPLSVAVLPGPQLGWRISYDPHRFTAVAIERLVGHLEALLQGMVDDPDAALGALLMLTAQERQQILAEWNDTDRPYPQAPMVHELVSAQVRRGPDRIAVASPAGQLSYGELEARANVLARRLRSLGVGPEVLVAVCTERTLQRVVGMLGVLKAGGAHVALDPTYPRERLSYLLDDARAAVLLTERRLDERLPASSVPVVCLDDGWIRGPEEPLPASGVGPWNLAYVVYTSGSTGRPKGVEIPHAGLMNLVLWHQSRYGLTPLDRGTQIASPAFDAAIWELWPYLAAGASLHIPDEEICLSSPGMIRWWLEQGITLSFLVTPLAEGVLEEGVPEVLDLAMRALLTGGDRLHRRPEPGSSFRLMNHYGPTESTVVSTMLEVPPAGAGAGLPSIGRPVANTRTYILDRHLRPVPTGVAGELCITGLGLARGYLGRPEMTAERFVPDLLGGAPGARMYRTGDLVRYRPDGEIEFLGRLDHQVKVRGLRIELGEIESVLAEHPAVREAVVQVREDHPGESRLVAYLTGVDGARLSAEEIRAQLKDRLPGYMIPASFCWLDALPLTANGKIDRRALPDPRPPAEIAEEPQNPFQEILGGIWREVLNVEAVRPLDSFFDLGGHSLLAMQLATRIRETFGTDLPLRQLLEAPTLAQQAERIERKRWGGETAQSVTIAPVPRQSGLPLSFAQERLWFLNQLEPENPIYNIPFAFRLVGALDSAALSASFAEVVRRHEVLRTTFSAPAGIPLQLIAPASELRLSLADVSALPLTLQAREAQRVAEREARQSFDLTRGPVIRVRLLRLAVDEHVLLVTQHHIVSDAWSAEILWDEVMALYLTFRTGTPSPLPLPPIQYADYAVWQRTRLVEELFEHQLAYWKRRLAGSPALIELPTDHPRLSAQTFCGAHLPVQLSPAAAAGLRRLAASQGVTVFMALLAVFQTLLRRYSGQSDVSVGTPISGRHWSETENLLGFFLNTLVIRLDLAGNPKFTELLGRLRDLCLEAYSHQDLPFEKLVDEVQPERSLSHSPLFQVMFVLLHAPRDRARVAQLRLAPFALETGTSKFDLTLSFVAATDLIAGSIEYNTDLFDETTIRRVCAHLRNLTDEVVEQCDRELSQLLLLAPVERHQLLLEVNDTARDLPQRHPVQELFEVQARRQPDVMAVAFAGRRLSYGELNRRANRLARLLRTCGVGSEGRVGLSVGRSLDFVVGLLAVLKAGGAYVPLDPAYPREQRAFMLADGRVAVLLTHEGRSDDLAGTGFSVVHLDRDGELIARQAGDDFPSGARADNLAYIIYTSGSTGRPKGVGLSHRALGNLIDWHLSALRGGVNTLQFASLSFDVSFLELFACWGSGGTLFVVSEEQHGDLSALAALLIEEQIEKAILPVVVLQELAERYAGSDVLPPLIEITTTGEQLRTSRAMSDLLQRLAGCTFHNHYGPSESHVATAYVLDRDTARWETHPSIGLPIANAQVHLLDRDLAPVPLGVAGELHIGGVCLARGYLGRPELTAEKFVPDHLSGRSGARLYRTGDKVRRLAAGKLDFLGRFDHQVKVRGFRVELEEIESILGQHPAVRQSLVLAHETAPGDRRLVAYIVPDASRAAVSTSEWRAFLKEKLPEYMVPSYFILLAVFPLTPNGKVDRRALPEPEGLRPHLASSYRAPRTPCEEIVAAIWCEVLGLDQVGVDDSFFELGGHSLLAMQLISRLREAFGFELPLRRVFEQPTVAGLAADVERFRRAVDVARIPAIESVSRKEPLLLSFAQQRLWFLDQLQPGSTAYNLPAAVRLRGPFDSSLLTAALTEVVRRHETLRTTLPALDGEAVQVIAPPAVLLVPTVDLRSLPEEVHRRETRRLAMQEGWRPFDLARGPLLRTALLISAEQVHDLLLTMHHIVSDGWSMALLVRELVALYGAFLAGRPSPLADLPIQYADFAHWQRRWLTGAALEEELAYWREQLAALPPEIRLPVDRPRPTVQTSRGASRPLHLDLELARNLRALARQQRATWFMVLLAGFKALLHRYSAQTDIVVGSPIAGRNNIQTEGLIGFFVNTLVLRTDLSGAPGFLPLLARVREMTLGAYSHQNLPFERLVAELQPERDLSKTPLFQVLFVLQNTPGVAVDIPGLQLEPLALESGAARFDLTLSLQETAAGLDGIVDYNLDLFDATTVDRIGRHFTALLAGAIAQPAERVSILPLLSGGERHQALVGWNDTGRKERSSLCLHQPFEEQAAHLPDAIALVHGDARLSFAQLNARANRLAHDLMRRGVALEDRVGICLERGPQLVICILAVLKAGGAYVPLDPTYPRERLQWIADDAQISLLITHGLPRALLPEGGFARLDLAAELRLSTEPETDPTSVALPQNLAYLIYTSGSTGRPKGVAIAHRSPLARVRWSTEVFTSAELAGVLAATSIAFDLSVFELFVPLSRGGKIVLADSALEAPSLFPANEIRLINTVPSAMAGLLQGELPPDLETVNLAGEALSPGLMEKIYQRQGVERVLNLYGPSEDTTYSTCARPEPGGRVTIGRPLTGTRVHVLDPNLEPVPIGVAGEIFLGGAGLARGYFARPELTAERFVPDPFDGSGGAAGERLYRTGDLGRFLPDGEVDFLGRSDHQVKLRGFRIELGEIESVLARHPGVAEVAVVLREDLAGGRGLVGHIVAAENGELTVAELRAWLRQRLPAFMMPAHFLLEERLPRTASGKVDRARLTGREWGPRHPGGEESAVAPRNATEEVLAGIWREVLGIERLSVHDNFFALGGDSILSIQVVSRAARAGLRLAPRQLFTHQTIAELAREAQVRTEAEAAAGPVTGAVLLTPIQRWFFAQDLPHREHFNQAIVLEIGVSTPAFRPDLLERALAHLVAHHDALRMRFEPPSSGDREWRQSYGDPSGWPLVVQVDVSGLPVERRERALAAAAGELQGSLDLMDGVLFRGALLTQGAGPDRLQLMIHHLVVDGVSWRILLEDLDTAYRQLAAGERVVLPPKTAAFQRWALHLAEQARSDAAAAELPYWLGRLQLSPAGLPVDFLRGPDLVGSAESLVVSLEAEETRALLQELPRVYRTHINDVLLAALVEALAPWTGNRRLRLDLEGHGREELAEDLDLSRTVGWFTAIFPVVLDLAGTLAPGEVLKSIKEQLRGIPRRGIGYGLLRYLAGEEASQALRSLPPSEIVFNYLGQLDLGAARGLFQPVGSAAGALRDPRQPRAHLLEINAGVSGGRLWVGWAFSRNRHRRSTIEAVAERFIAALRSFLVHCLSPGAGGYTPADFPLARLGQPALDRLSRTVGRGLDDLYPASPTQQGMLFHTLHSPESGVYVEQLSLTLQMELDLDAFERAWQQLIVRHPILRTSFAWTELDRPLQLVHSAVDLAWERLDWRSLSDPEQAAAFAAYLAEERRRGFDLARPPLMRLALFRLDENQYRFVWTHHHILLDGWSLPLLLQELSALYQVSLTGGAAALEHRRPYRDYIAWLESQDLTGAERFWRGVLLGLSAPTPLGIDRARAAGDAAERPGQGVMGRRLSLSSTESLRAWARRHGLTLSTLAQGAWALLLRCYSAREDVVFGVVTSGRSAPLPGIEGMVGLFINTLPARVRIPESAELASWLAEVQEQQAEVRQYEFSPLYQLRSWSAIPAGQPLFESTLAFENYPLAESVRDASGQALWIEQAEALEQSSYPLAVAVAPGSRLSLRIAFDHRRFDSASIQRMLGHLSILLESLPADPPARPADLTVLSAAERQACLREWNDTGSGGSADRPLRELFKLQVERCPEAVAVVFDDRWLSYRELDRRAARLAGRLRALGVGPEVRVGLAVERCPEMVVGLLAVLKAGGAYVPLDLAHPRERLALQLADIGQEQGAPVLLTRRSLRERFTATSSMLVWLDHDLPAEGDRPDGAALQAGAVDIANAAYVIYTSGSTGRPKGVVVEHRQIVNYLQGLLSQLSIVGGASFAMMQPLTFDSSCSTVYPSLLGGGTLHLISEQNVLEPQVLAEYFARHGIDVLKITPSHLTALAGAVGMRRILPRRWLIFGGEASRRDWALELAAASESCRVLHHYGPTEATVGMLTCRVGPGLESGSSHTTPLGRPLPASRAYVLDSALALAPVGVPGELHIGGDCLARGYLGQPHRTAERFIPNPFAGMVERGSRLYKTGDLARLLPTGRLEFLGRIDDQVKLRGVRIELGEIEAVLGQHPAVRESAAAVWRDASGSDVLIGYVVSQGGATLEAGELRRFLKEHLPESMVPAVFMFLKGLPRTAHGKLDRRSLPRPEPVGEQTFVAPRNRVEEVLAEVWREVLRLERVGIHDNYFELGGDSILSIQIVSRAARAGLRITPGQVFDRPTLAGLASVAAAIEGGEAEARPSRGPFPLTPIQRRFFALDLPQPEHYNQALLLAMERVDPALGPGARGLLLRRALAYLMTHHDALSLRFAAPAGEEAPWIQVSGEVVTAPCLQIDLAALAEDRQRSVLEAAAARLEASLDLRHGPLLRVALFTLGGDQRDRLLWVIHHLVVDGVSWRILLEDLETAWRALAAGRPVELLPKTTSFRRWAEHLAARAHDPALCAEGPFWLERLALGASPLPVDFATGPDDVASSRTAMVALSAEETRLLLREAPRAYRAQINDVLLTALVEAIASQTGERRLVLALEGHGREEGASGLDLSRTVGWFTALYPVLLDLREIAPGGESLRSVKEQLRAVPGRGLGYGLLRYVEEGEIGRQLGSLPMPTVAFNYLGQFDPSLTADRLFRLAHESAGSARSRRQPLPYQVEVIGSISEGRLQVGWSYSRNRFLPTTIESIAESFLEALRQILADCRAREIPAYTPSDFPLAPLAPQVLDRVVTEVGGPLEDLYPTSPMQQGLLFHSLRFPHSGVYVEQLRLTLAAALDLAAFEGAWQRLVERHQVLRTTFLFRDLDEPLQVVHPSVRIAWERHDWRSSSATEQRRRLTAYLDEDRRRGFDLAVAPLMRGALIRIDEERHWFLWSHHHLLLDGWSMPILLRELVLLYGAGQGDAPLGEPRPYRDYIVWLQSQDLAAAERFWRRTLAGFGEATPLGTDDLAEGGTKGRGEHLTVLAAEESEALRAFARRHHLTLNTLAQGAWALLVQRYSGRDDVVFGTVTSGRSAPLPGIESMIGLFINSLPARVRVSPGRGLLAWLEDLQARLSELRQYEYSPLVQVQSWSEVPRGRPLFETLTVFENYPLDEAVREQAGSGLGVAESEAWEQTNYPLTLVVSPTVQWGLRLLYDANRFDEVSVERRLRHLVNLLTGMIADPAGALDGLPLLTPAERHQLLVEGSGEERWEVENCLHRRFRSQVERTPDAVAVTCEARALTYAELDARAERLGFALRSRGVGPEVPVGLSAERSLEMVVGMLGILKAGGAYVPIDPAYPEERLSFLVDDALGRTEPAVLLTEPRSIERFQDRAPGGRSALQVISLEGVDRAGAEGLDLPDVPPASLAYIIYTSGSTGRPKGVPVTHANVVRLFQTTDRWFGFSAGDVWTLFHSFAFDFSVWELWGALLYGGRLVIVPYWVSRSPEAFHALLLREGVTVLNQTPSAFHLLVQADQRVAAARAGFALRLVVFGGEALDLAALEPWFERHGETAPRLVNMYGITETTVHVTYRPVSRADLEKPRRSPIGRPLPDLGLYLLDPWFAPVPLGAPGELYVGGGGVARGYFGRPELAAERFVPDPFGEEWGARLYRTGDLARRRPDGGLDYLGRADHQVKIRGFRIELGEIEAALLKHPEVCQALVLAREAPSGRRLVAYLVPSSEAAPKSEEMRAFLERRLPEHMIPAGFVTLAALPLTAHGKVDRSALPAPDLVALHAEREYAPPATPTESAIAEIWAAVLGLERVGARDNFFSLGGDSILSIRVLARARDRGLEVTIEQIFSHQTVHELARAVEGAAGAAARLRTSPFSLIAESDRSRMPAGVEDAYPLAQLQAGMLFHGELDPERAVYHDILSLHLRAPFDPPRLWQAIVRVVARHPILRTSFDLTTWSEPLQLVWSTAEAELAIIDLLRFDDRRQEELLAAWREAEKRRPFDWRRMPLLRFSVHLRSAETFQIGLSLHHAILDGWSLSTLLAELFQTYLALRRGEEPAGGMELPSTFRQFVALERQASESAESRRYWEAQLAGATVTALPRWLSGRTRMGGGAHQDHEVLLPLVLSELLQERARGAGLPVKSLLLAAHCWVLSALGGSLEVITGLVTNGRPEEEGGEQILGLFLNTLPFRLALPGGTWRELSQQVFGAERELLVHRRYPMGELQRKAGGQPLFEAVFNFVHFHLYQGLGQNDEIRPLGEDFFRHTNFTFVAAFSQSPWSAQLHLRLEYDVEQFPRGQIEAIADLYQRALRALAEEPEARYDSSPLLTEAERQQILVEWNDMERSCPQVPMVHELASAHARRDPDRIAVASPDGQLSYGELEARANLLAHRLRALGAGPEVLVAVCTERTLQRVVGMLGVLKAGGAHVALDPTYPRERLAFLLDDARAAVLLTERRFYERLPASSAPVICLDEGWDSIRAAAAPLPASGVGPLNLAYVVYTSGSTGKPKGVEIPHAGLMNLVRWHQNLYGVTPADRGTQIASPAFDAAIWELWPYLSAGASLHIPDEETRLSSPGMIRWWAEQEITLAYLMTPLAEGVLEEGVPAGLPLATRALIIGGDRLHRRPAPGTCFRLMNHYGPAEYSVTSTVVEVPPADAGAGIPSIGRPVDNTWIYILDRHLRPVPIGVLGELFVTGLGLARGYLRRPEMTAEKFVPDPLSAEPGARMYRTGDLVRYLPDGEMDFLGRLDHQVKLRGLRIELGEIESVLAEHPAVREAVVQVREDRPGHKRLTAYVVAAVDPPPAIDELRGFVRERLPEYMVPTAFSLLPALPLTPNGKVDRRALTAPALDAERAYQAPRTPVEETLARLWAELLRLDRISVNDNFFELGGHSLLATRFIARVREELGVAVPLRGIFEAPTIETFAELILNLQVRAQDEAELDRLLAELELLSDEEAEERLAASRQEDLDE